MGVTQSIGSLARIIGPLIALGLLDVSIRLPYFICAAIAVVAAIVAAVLLKPADKALLVAEAGLREKKVGEKPPGKINLRGKTIHEEGVEGESQAQVGPKRINLRAKPTEDVDSGANEKEEG